MPDPPSGAWPFTEWRLGRALAEGDSDVEDCSSASSHGYSGDAEQAKTRLDAAPDALSASRGMAEPEETAQDAPGRVWEALSGRMADAEGDVTKLNAVLRETFDTFQLAQGTGGLRTIPVISAAVLARMDRISAAFDPPSAVAIDEHGEQVALPRGSPGPKRSILRYSGSRLGAG